MPEYITEGNEALANTLSMLNIKAIDLQYISDNYDRMFQETLVYKEKDVGIKNMSNRSRVKISENGNVEMFSGDATGVLINSHFKTTNLYGNAINQNASLIRMNTEPNGLMWNDWWANPKLYQISDKLNPRLWTGEPGRPLAGKKYMDDLKVSVSARWWCPGSPRLCGSDESHSGHWVRTQFSVTPYFRAWEDVEYKKQLDELGIPI